MNMTLSHFTGQVVRKMAQITLKTFWIVLYIGVAVGLIRFNLDGNENPTVLASIIGMLAIPSCSYFYWLFRKWTHTTSGVSVWQMLGNFVKHSCVIGAMSLGGAVNQKRPALGCCIGGIAGVLTVFTVSVILNLPPKPDPYATELLRGTNIMTVKQGYEKARSVTNPGEEMILWPGMPFPERLCSGHLAMIGTVGSAKTVIMRMMMQSILPGIGGGNPNRRCIIFDAKRDILSILSGIRIRSPVYLFNPMDTRSAAWDIAKDVKGSTIASQIAHNFIKENKNENPFFTEAARDLFAGIIEAYTFKKPDRWTLFEVLNTLSNTEESLALLQSFPQTQHVAREHFERSELTRSNVQYTCTSSLGKLRSIASLWERASEKISLTEWVQSDSILILGNDENLRGPLDAINRVLFQRLSELILSQSESDTRRTWVFLDELKEMGKLDNLPRLLNEGRSKGVRAVLGWQQIEGIKEVYGEQLGSEIAGICASKALLRTDSPATADFFCSVVGKSEYSEWTRGVTKGKDTTNSHNQQNVTKDTVLPAFFMRMPRANRSRFYGCFVSPDIGVYAGPIRFDHVLDKRGSMQNYIPRPIEDQYAAYESMPTEVAPSLGDTPKFRINRDKLKWPFGRSNKSKGS